VILLEREQDHTYIHTYIIGAGGESIPATDLSHPPAFGLLKAGGRRNL